jgi:hypothetical protein
MDNVRTWAEVNSDVAEPVVRAANDLSNLITYMNLPHGHHEVEGTVVLESLLGIRDWLSRAIDAYYGDV